MLPNLAVLKAKCEELGLTVIQRGKRPAKQDYVSVLRKHFLPDGGIPYEEVSPMLCFAEWNLKDDEKKAVWESPDWWAQKKLNGCRAMVHFIEGKGVYIHSRTVSLKTYRFQELTPNFLFYKYIPDFTATIDCEVKVNKKVDTRPYTAKGELTESTLHSTTAILHLEAKNARLLQEAQDAPLELYILDVVKWKHQDCRNLPLTRRVRAIELFMNKVLRVEIPMEVGKYFHEVEMVRTGKREYYQEYVDAGGEGLVFKHKDSKYVASTSRDRNAWVKAKDRMEFDAFVSGFIRGEKGTAWENMVGALEFSVLDEKTMKLHAIANCSNLTMELRQKITRYDKMNDAVYLQPGWMGKVAEVSGQDITPRVYRLSHATIERWRDQRGDEKNKEDCTVSVKGLKKRAEWKEAEAG